MPPVARPPVGRSHLEAPAMAAPCPPTVSSSPAPTRTAHDALHGRPVLVTGATGFLGRHLSRLLLDLGAEVHALTRDAGSERPALPGVTWHRGDLTDPSAVESIA